MYPSILGSVAGDIIGSAYEFNPDKNTNINLFPDECFFTDDTVLTIAVADCILNKKDFARTFHAYGNKYPGRGYGGMFARWLEGNDLKPYNSLGNGSAMRVSPVGFAGNSLIDVLDMARRSAEVTHDHLDGIKGAQAIAASVFMAKNGNSKEEIRAYITSRFNYNLNRTIASIRPAYSFDETCPGSVPEAIIAFLDSTDYESALRLSISLGGDSDTLACMAGGIAAAFYRSIPEQIERFAISKLPPEFIDIIKKFDKALEKGTIPPHSAS
jgi:ADP-ribosylglycohydrolase